MNVRLIIPINSALSTCPHDPTPYLRTIANIAGGYTSYRGQGGWINSMGLLVEEPVTIVDCNIQSHTDWGLSPVAIGCVKAFRALARTIAVELSQECVFLSIDGKAELVRP